MLAPRPLGSATGSPRLARDDYAVAGGRVSVDRATPEWMVREHGPTGDVETEANQIRIFDRQRGCLLLEADPSLVAGYQLGIPAAAFAFAPQAAGGVARPRMARLRRSVRTGAN
jgi:hypothetical protein